MPYFTTNKHIWLFNFYIVECQVIINMEASNLVPRVTHLKAPYAVGKFKSQSVFACTKVFEKNTTTFGEKTFKIIYEMGSNSTEISWENTFLLKPS